MAQSELSSVTLQAQKQPGGSEGTRQRTMRWNLVFVVVASLVSCASASPFTATTRSSPLPSWGSRSSLSQNQTPLSTRIMSLPRGGAVDEDEEYDDEEYDEYDSEDEEEMDEASGVQIEMNVEKYDEPLVASPMANLYASFGAMMLARKVDLFSPSVVRIARAVFIGYLILLQIFLLYVRVSAKSTNDRTPITLKNPLSSVLQSQLGPKGGNDMMKGLASSFLSSKSTVMEYDLKQARSMQSGLIINMGFMWFLHFKMGQVQPLIIQSATGLVSMIYSPLFQIYGMGRNLERPFKSANAQKLEEMTGTAATPEPEAAATVAVSSSEEQDAEATIESIESSDDEEEEEEEEEMYDDDEEEEEEEEADGEDASDDEDEEDASDEDDEYDSDSEEEDEL